MINIGIDLDNTIINYNPFFRKYLTNKESLKSNSFKCEVKKKFAKSYRNETNWMKLQGKAYGECINEADIYQGFLNFLAIAKHNNANIKIISHKTTFGHFDKKKIKLRDRSIGFLKENLIYNEINYFYEINDIFFFENFDSKINFINSLKLDFFIDDLPKVIDSIHSKKKILFNSSENIVKKEVYCFNHWDQITKFIFHTTSTLYIKKMINLNSNFEIISISKIQSNRNSRVYKLLDNNKKEYFLKVFPIRYQNNLSDLNKIDREIIALKTLKKIHINHVPSLLHFDKEFNFLITSWEKGQKKKKIDEEFLSSLFNFIKKIHLNSKLLKNNFKLLPLAKDAVLNYDDIIIDIKKRINLFKNNKRKIPRDVFNIILDVEKLFIIQNIKNKNYIKRKNFRFQVNFNKQLLSPSDMGLHNCIYNNKIFKFYDFEYFGRDDPVKLLCDIILNPNTFFCSKSLKIFFNNYVSLFKDRSFRQRYKITFRLHLLKWILIILKKYNEGECSIPFSKKETQYKKSKLYLANYKKLDSSLYFFSDIN